MPKLRLHESQPDDIPTKGRRKGTRKCGALSGVQRTVQRRSIENTSITLAFEMWPCSFCTLRSISVIDIIERGVEISDFERAPEVHLQHISPFFVRKCVEITGRDDGSIVDQDMYTPEA